MANYFMFSSRFIWNLAPNQFAQIAAEKKAAGTPLLDLTLSNPTRAGLVYPQDNFMQRLAQPEALQYEPTPRGLLAARTAIADYYAARGQAVEPDQLFLTASTSEAYAWLFKLLTDNGDEVLVPQPSYPLFEFLATLEGVTLSPYALEYLHPHGWQIDFATLEKNITAKTKAIILVNPNNPTGSYLKQKEAAHLEEICRAHNLALIVDEVFADFDFGMDENRVTDFSQQRALTFVLNGFSKMLGLPQMKLGWILVQGQSPFRTEAEQKLELIADTFLSVNTPVQIAAPHWLGLRSIIQAPLKTRLNDNLEFLAQAVLDTPLRLLKVEGGWSAVLEVPRNDSEEAVILQLLSEENLLVQPGYFFDFPREAFLIVSLLTPSAAFRQGIKQIMRRWI